MMRYGLAIILSVTSSLMANAFAEDPERAAQELVASVQALVEALDPVQEDALTLRFDADEREGWSFFPGVRPGLRIGDLQPLLQEQVLEILKSGLSAAGYAKAEDIRSLEEVLGGNYNTGNYYLTLFGAPDAEIWGLRWEGHHLSLNWTIAGGRVIATTPQFLGANPAEIKAGPREGHRALAGEEDLARALLESLDETQRTAAIIADRAPADILTGMSREAAIQENSGVAWNDLNESQQGQLMSLIETYAEVQRPALKEARLEKLKAAGLETIRFAWMGGTEKGQGHYYRIQGATFLIEYDNVQNNANHIHTVWRDFDGDFGRDVLKEHYQAHAQDPEHGHHSHGDEHGHSHEHGH